MNVLRTVLFLGAALGLRASEPPPLQQAQEPATYVEEIKKDFLEKVDKYEAARDWKNLFATVRYGLGGHADAAGKPVPGRYVETVVKVEENRWTSLGEYLLSRLSKLPAEAYEHYRLDYDGIAETEFAKARERGSRRDLERLAETYFFARGADRVLDSLAVASFDEGRAEEAVFFWNRLLRYYPDSEIPRAVTAARIAHACRVAGNEEALDDLRAHVRQSKLEGKLSAAGETRDLAAYLDSVRVPPRLVAPRPLKVPYAQGPLDRQGRRPIAVRNDIKRWTYDFSQDRDESTGQAVPERVNPLLARRLAMMRGEMAQQGTPQEFPMFPAHARVRGRDYVIFTDGTRVVAADPARVRKVQVQEGGKTVEKDLGIYWKYPDKPVSRGAQGSNPNQFVGINRPYVGVTVDGEYAFATMYSDPRVRPREVNPQTGDLFEGATALKCLHIPSGKLVWDTDAFPLHDELKEAGRKFFDRNFAFASHPLVRGERLFVGICTSPMGEQEARVLCLDKRTGRPLWTTFLASTSNRSPERAWNWGAGRLVSFQTLLAEQGGTLYAQTNLGAVAALNPVTGGILWLSRYERSSRRGAAATAPDGGLGRPANWPVVCRGYLFVLPQDSADLLVFERLSGKPVPFPPVLSGEQPLAWNTMSHLLGIVSQPNSRGEVEDWLVVSGQVSHVIKVPGPLPADGKPPELLAFTLAASNAWKAGRGVIDGDVVYLSCTVNDSSSAPPAPGGAPVPSVGALGLYDVRTWKNLEKLAWKGENEYGNLLVAGNFLVAAAAQIVVYTDVETLRADFVHRLGQSPPHAETLLEFGNVMFENDRLAEAGEAYLAFIRAAEGDARHAGTAREVKRKLHETYLRRGDEAADRKDFARAIEFYGFAKSFAFDDATRSEATRKLAFTYERQQRWKEAVSQYQELVEGSRDLYHRESERVVKLWDHARERIADILGKAPDAYEEVEKRAAEALRKAADGGAAALRAVMDRFPNSRTARDAWTRLKELFLREGKLDKLRSLFGELKDRFKLDLDFDQTRELLQVLEKLEDAERLRFELARFGERFGERTIGTEGMEESVKDYVARRLAQLPRGGRGALPLAWPLRPLGEMEAVKTDPQGAGSGRIPLRPRGVEPPGFAPHLELFRRGSSVELWDLRERRRLWARARPGAWLGALYGQGAELATDGLPLSGVRPDSPAQRAGLRNGDVLLSVAERPVTALSLPDVLGEMEPGRPVELVFRRAEVLERARVELAEQPHDQRPSIVGASWTRDYALAVAWEDGAASLDPATGEPLWSFRGIRPRFHVRAFGSTDGRIYLYESFRHDRDRDPSWVATGSARSRSLTPSTDLSHRVHCLNDSTGEPVWVHPFDLAAGDPSVDVQAEFLGKYLSDHAALFQTVTRAGNRDWSLWVFPAEAGAAPERRPLVGGPLLAHAADEDAGMFYYVTEITGERRERHLCARSFEGGKKEPKPLEFGLGQGKYMPPTPQNHPNVALAAEGGLVALFVAPTQAGRESRIWIFKDGKPHRPVTLPEKRTLPLGKPGGMLLQDGVLHVYNVPADKPGPGGRAFLTAYRADEGPEGPLWEAVAPGVSPAASSAWTLLPGTGGLVVLSSLRASLPGQPGESAMTVVYDKAAEGYLRQEHLQLVPFPDGPGSTSTATAWRGRLYVSAPQGVQVFGR